MSQIPREEEVQRKEQTESVRGGAFDGVQASPFDQGRGEGVDAGSDEPAEWIVNKDRYKADEIFHTLNPVDGKITGKII